MYSLILAAALTQYGLPADLQFYPRTQYNQWLSITNGRDSTLLVRLDHDDVLANAPTVRNPNRLFPWAVSGGMDQCADVRSQLAVRFPPGQSVTVWREYVEAGASRRLPKLRWRFPEGTLFVDVLSVDGTVFEVRVREKLGGEWRSRVPFRGIAPANYRGPGRACVECHRHAGGFLSYGSHLRGDDGVFSWSPLIEGTWQLDSRWPVAQK